MRYFCSFPPKVTFPRCSEEFLFPLTKILKIYYIDNQLVIFLTLFRDYPYTNPSNETETTPLWHCLCYEHRGEVDHRKEAVGATRLLSYPPITR